MTFAELQRWQTRLTVLLESHDAEEAVRHALEFPTPAYRLRSLIRVSRAINDAERARTLLAQACELVAAIEQPQAQSHAWGRLCRTYGCRGLIAEAEACADRVADRSAQRAHRDWLHRRTLPDDQKPRRVRRPRQTPELVNLDPKLLQAIVAARDETATARAVWALLTTVGFRVGGIGEGDRTLFRAAMDHALRGLPSQNPCRNALESLCFHGDEPELARRFYDACLLAARREPESEWRADALIQILWASPRYEDRAGVENLWAEARATIATIPDRRLRERAYTALAARLHGLGWRGRRHGCWEQA